MSGLTLTAVEGAHLTAADRRNVKALIAHGFEDGLVYRVGRKRYSLVAAADRADVTIYEPDTDDYGRKFTRTYKSTITIRKASS